MSKSGIWLLVGVGFLGLIAVLGIIAAILIPNFFDALQKAKQKRTVADIRNLGTALFSFQTDKGYLPPPEGLSSALVPEYLQSLPNEDGWKKPLTYICWQEDSSAQGCDHFRLGSAGRDGVFEQEDLREYEQQDPFLPTDYDRDIIYGDGLFLQYPGTASPQSP